MYVGVYIYIYVYMYVHVCMYISISMSIYIYVYTRRTGALHASLNLEACASARFMNQHHKIKGVRYKSKVCTPHGKFPAAPLPLA